MDFRVLRIVVFYRQIVANTFMPHNYICSQRFDENIFFLRNETDRLHEQLNLKYNI